MLKLVILGLFATCALASYLPYHKPQVIKVVEKEAPPTPYEFSYDIVDEDGNKQGRTESGDAHGNKKGSYSMQLADGRQRMVEYVSDDKGTRMVVRTNEQGTDGQSPADVDLTVDGPLVTKEAPKVKKVIIKEAPVQYKLIKVPIHAGYY